MNKTTKFKRALALVMTLSMLLCILGSFSILKASAITDNVSLYSSEVYFSKYGMSRRYIYVQTNDNASNQHVYVHYKYLEGQDWQDEEATYFTTLPDGSKIWKADIGSYSTEYAIKYVADGVTYWDNNNGNNYTHEKIGTAPITANRSYSSYYGSFYINATLQNYAYDKVVKVRYTEDNWATYTDVPLKYSLTNSDGTEDWTTTLTLDSDKTDSFQYCIYYEVNNQTYWANNFGENYGYNYRVYP